MMGENESGTLTALKLHRVELIDPTIAAWRGRIVSTAGDGMLLEFASAVDAVNCSINIQEAMSARNVDLPASARMLFRIGVNLGDVIVDGNDLFGDGVNVAARLEAMALPGGISISGSVHEQVLGKLPHVFDDAGLHKTKNIERPIQIWTWPAVGSPKPQACLTEVTRCNTVEMRPAVAVLPFDNMSADPDQDHFADGLTEDMITALTYWRSFRVIARNSSFAYRKHSIDIREAGRALTARYVLEGSVRTQGAKVRINAQLINCETGHHVWASKFDRDLDDIFQAQDEIVQAIAAVVAPELERAEMERAAAKPNGDLDAWDLCLRAKALARRRTPDDLAAARDMFSQAIAMQQDCSDAHAGLAMSFNASAIVGATEDPRAAASLAMTAARRAIDYDASSSWAHHELSTAYQLLGRTEDALDEARMAVALNPNDAYALHALGNKADLAGDPDGLGFMERAQALSADDARRPVQLTFLARAFLNAGEPHEAVTRAREAVRRQPDLASAHFLLTLGLAASGRLESAQAALHACDAISPGFVASRRNWRPYADDAANRRLAELLIAVTAE